jgi:hypothetical protein
VFQQPQDKSALEARVRKDRLEVVRCRPQDVRRKDQRCCQLTLRCKV